MRGRHHKKRTKERKRRKRTREQAVKNGERDLVGRDMPWPWPFALGQGFKPGEINHLPLRPIHTSKVNPLSYRHLEHKTAPHPVSTFDYAELEKRLFLKMLNGERHGSSEEKEQEQAQTLGACETKSA